jgi:predicted nicotinamide N-methyase
MKDKMWTLNSIEQQVHSPRDICLLRHALLENEGIGFAATFVPLMQQELEAWLESLQQIQTCFHVENKDDLNANASSDSYVCKCSTIEHKHLSQALYIHMAVALKDPILAEECGHQGSHMLLAKLIGHDVSPYSEQLQDTIMELQDLACEIAACSASFPLKLAPISNLIERLPLCISFSPNHKVLIQQVTSRQTSQKDVGFVLWPSAVALSHWLIDHPEVFGGVQSILELGAGCGLVGLLAAMLVQEQDNNNNNTMTILTDFNPIVLDNLRLNIELNSVHAQARKLDFYQQSGHVEYWVGDDTDEAQAQVDLILAADMICQPSDAVAAANTIHDALRSGGTAIVVCANGTHRFGVDAFQGECTRVGLLVETSNVVDKVDSMHLTAGYVDGMSLTMFTIHKL